MRMDRVQCSRDCTKRWKWIKRLKARSEQWKTVDENGLNVEERHDDG